MATKQSTTKNVRLTPEDTPVVEKAIQILKKRGLVKVTAADAFRQALAEFVERSR
jgi:hypothetical protein